MMNAQRNYRPALGLCLATAAGLVLVNACGDDDGGDDGSGGSAGSAGSGSMAGAGSGGTGMGQAGSMSQAGSSGMPTGTAAPDCGTPAEPSIPPIQLTEIASGLESPLYLTGVPGDDSRLIVVSREGTLRVIRDGELLEEPLLDITDSVDTNFGEMGLLGLAFHPDYQDNRRFFVMYSTNAQDGDFPPHDGVLEEYQTSADNPDRVDDSVAARRLLTVAQPEANHNGGNLQFGPDGFLYIGLGDGGGAGDDHGAIGNGQSLDTLLGKILRIDVDSQDAGEYGIPDGNMADTNPDALPEIWSYGWRNPWRYSFDACTGDMYIADVGQDEIEEVDFEPANTPGRNYGWRLMEGDECFNPDTGCDPQEQNLVLPVATYPHQGAEITGTSITGGYVYRGSAIPALRGTYLYADYISNEILALRMEDGDVAMAQTAITENLNPGGSVENISSFGEDNAGELYVVSLQGSVYRIDPE